MRYFIKLAYLGTAYHGWQRQPNAITVQQVLEDALAKLLRTKVELVGCGRTDTGVHSSQYYAHFEHDNSVDLNQNFIFHLNCCLPPDIAVYDIYPCELHARFDAVSREYKYIILREKSPFEIKQNWLISQPLNEDLMKFAAAKLLNYTDFSSFAKTGSDNKTNICKIVRADWEFSEKRYIFTIVADRFLRSMVRSVVGALVEVGREKISIKEFEEMIKAKKRDDRCPLAIADGLFLNEIKYK